MSSSSIDLSLLNKFTKLEALQLKGFNQIKI